MEVLCRAAVDPLKPFVSSRVNINSLTELSVLSWGQVNVQYLKCVFLSGNKEIVSGIE